MRPTPSGVNVQAEQTHSANSWGAIELKKIIIIILHIALFELMGPAERALIEKKQRPDLLWNDLSSSSFLSEGYVRDTGVIWDFFIFIVMCDNIELQDFDKRSFRSSLGRFLIGGAELLLYFRHIYVSIKYSSSPTEYKPPVKLWHDMYICTSSNNSHRFESCHDYPH